MPKTPDMPAVMKAETKIISAIFMKRLMDGFDLNSISVLKKVMCHLMAVSRQIR